MEFKPENNNTKVTHCSKGYGILGNDFSSFPIVFDNGGICIEITNYLLNEFYGLNKKYRTVEKSAFILAEWVDYLSIRGVKIFSVDVNHLRSFIKGGGGRQGNVLAFPIKIQSDNVSKTNAHKIGVIVSFYSFHLRVYGISTPGSDHEKIGLLNETLFAKDSNSEHISKAKLGKTSGPEIKDSRLVPNKDQTDEIEQKANELGETPYSRETWSLITRCLSKCGMRAGGPTSLTVNNLLKALVKEPAFMKLEGYRDVLKKHSSRENRKIIIDIIGVINKTRRKYMYCEIKEKTGWREAPIPIDLYLDLLDYVWTTREEFITTRFAEKNRKKVPDEVFLSHRNAALTPEAVTNKLREIHRAVQFPGSAHMLRHAFCHTVVTDTYLQHRAIHGKAWDARVVLETARVRLGHKGIETLRPYLDRVLRDEAELGGEPVLLSDPEDAALLRGIAMVLNDEYNEKRSEVRRMLRSVLQENELSPLYEYT